jgi:hypothetical protein
MEQERQTTTDSRRLPQDGKKPYAPPRLVVYGKVTEVTRADSSDTSSTIPSDRHAKAGLAAVDPDAILAGVVTLPIETWSYKSEPPAVRHIGPMAQDFAATFGVGEDDRRIHMVDASGVALAAIQGLHRLIVSQEARIEALTREITALRGESRQWAPVDPGAPTEA